MTLRMLYLGMFYYIDSCFINLQLVKWIIFRYNLSILFDISVVIIRGDVVSYLTSMVKASLQYLLRIRITMY